MTASPHPNLGLECRKVAGCRPKSESRLRPGAFDPEPPAVRKADSRRSHRERRSKPDHRVRCLATIHFTLTGSLGISRRGLGLVASL
jgi:hypothetical protein